jgi:hypothetical protein
MSERIVILIVTAAPAATRHPPLDPAGPTPSIVPLYFVPAFSFLSSFSLPLFSIFSPLYSAVLELCTVAKWPLDCSDAVKQENKSRE